MTDPSSAKAFDHVPASHRDLLLEPHTAVLTTVDAKGRPQSSAVFYALDDEGVLVGSVTTDRQKYRNLRNNPSCTLFILDPVNRRRALEIRADVELVADPEMDVLRRFADRYDMPFETLARSGNQERVAMRFRPWRVIAKAAN